MALRMLSDLLQTVSSPVFYVDLSTFSQKDLFTPDVSRTRIPAVVA